jgi:serine phosphatase RsbU (regulator of sigma subunit)
LGPLGAIGRLVRRSLFAKFILVTIGIGLIANGVALIAFYQYRVSYAIGSVAAEIATVANRVGSPVARYAATDDLAPARDLLAVFAAFPYIVCADFLQGDDVAVSWPVIGCARIKRAGEDVRIAVPSAAGPASLVVRYDPEHVLAAVHREFLILGGLAIVGGLAIILPAVVAFRRTINRPLTRMLGAIERFEQNDLTARVDYHALDEIGQVTRSYDAMLDREVERGNEIREAHHAIVESVSYASRIQRGLLPRAERLATTFADFAVLWQPRDVVGGDIYWVSAAGRLPMIVVLDCTGHGVPGGFMTMLAISTLERVSAQHDDLGPAALLGQLNTLTRRLLNQDGPHPSSNDGMDAAALQIDAANGTAIFAGARLSLLVAQGDQVRRVRGDKASIGYADSPAELRLAETRVPLDASTRLLLATDGVIDQPGGPKQIAFGYERLRRSFARQGTKRLEGAIEGMKVAFDTYAQGEVRRDDVTMVAIAPRLA